MNILSPVDLRGSLRAKIRHFLGPEFETRVHVNYHKLLQSLGRFGIPETSETQGLLRQLSKSSSTLIDVGANVGRYTRFFAKHCADNATVYSFEPNPSAYRLLRANTSKLPNVSSFSVALGESREIRGLQTPTDKFGNPISALSSVDQSANFANATSEAIEIQSLDAMIQDEAIEVRAPILMKIDVEGYEMQVLKGALEMISKQHPMIYFECQEYHLARTKIEPEKIWNLFKTQDYMILSEKNGSLFEKHNIDTDTENYFAFHKSHIENWKDIINYPYFHINY